MTLLDGALVHQFDDTRRSPETSRPEHTAELHRPRLDGGPTGWRAFGKRAGDVVVALLLVLLVLPVLAAAALAVRLSSPGPILFRQSRVGKEGRIFTMLKFRTFPVEHRDVEQSLPVDACPLPLGRLLRRTSLDELPQLFNVIRGDMSLVGPRPERPVFATEIAATMPEYRERHRAPAGITGLAQVRGLCGPTSIEDRVRADNQYVESWSLLRDAGILLLTIPTVVRKIRW